MPRTKKRKQGLVAKLESKSFFKNDTAVVSIRLQYHNFTGAAIPDYISQAVVPVPECDPGGRCIREIPVGMIRPSNWKDRRWVIRRILAGLYLDHLGLEKQLYRRSGILVFTSSKAFRIWDLLVGVHKVVDGERKPLTALLREALINNEGSYLARTTWAMLLLAIGQESRSVVATVRVQRTRAVAVRTTKPTIETARRKLATLQLHHQPVNSGWVVGDINVLSSRFDPRRSSWVQGTEHVSATRCMATDMQHMNQADGRRTRLGIWFYQEMEFMNYFEVSPHKAVVTMVSLMSSMLSSLPSWVATDPRPILNGLLDKHPKDLTMAEVIRAFRRIWPFDSTMPDKDQRSSWGNFVQWYPMPFQHAEHTK